MQTQHQKKLLATLIAVLTLAIAPVVAAQMAPPTGGTTTPPTGGTTPPPGGTTTPPPGGTTTPPTGGTTTPPTGGTTTPPPGGTTTPPTGGTTSPPTSGTDGSGAICYQGTTPPPGSTLPSCSSIGLNPSGGGTTAPPTGGTTTPPPGGCAIPTPGVTLPAGTKTCDFSLPTAGSTGTDVSSFFNNVSLTQLGNMSADQMAKFSPSAASGFSASQLGALSPSALSGMNADLLKNLTPSAMSGLQDTQIAALLPDALKGMTASQLQNLSPSAMDGFTSSQISQMQPTQVAAFTPQQFAKLDTSAISGVTPAQFQSLSPSALSTLDTSKIAALDNSVVKTLDKQALSNLDASAIKQMSSTELSEMLVNMDKQKLAPTDVTSILPANWGIDTKTGKLQPPAGAPITLKTANTSTLPSDIKMPTLPDLGTGVALGGDSSAGSVMDGMKKALESAGLPGFDLFQKEGVLNVQGTGAKTGTNLAFIPDNSKIKQAPTGTPPGVTKDAEGRYVLTTPEGTQVPVIPALTKPDDLAKVAPGTKVTVDGSGATLIAPPGSVPLSGIPDPTVTKSTLTPGVHREGTGANEKVTVVYEDGTAQTLKPTIQNPDEFRTAASSFPQITDTKIGTDGIVTVIYNGQTLKLQPQFDVTPASGSSTSAGKPGITGGANGQFTFVDSKGATQLFNLVK